MNSLKDKVVLITGSAVRIGKAISLSLKTSKLILHYHESEREAVTLKEELQKLGCHCSLYKADFNDSIEIHKLFKFIKTQYGHLDILINNAATFDQKPFLEIEDFDKTLNINLKAPLIISQLAAKIMRKGSSIINICDPSARKPFRNYLLHGVSKAALMYSTKALALELSPDIRVNNLLIGIALPSVDYNQEDIKKLTKKHVLLKRSAHLDEIIKSIHFLIENEYINGSTLELDGGWI